MLSFFVAEFSGCPIFCCPFFWLPFFPWSLPFSLFQTILCCLFFLPYQFSLPNFPIAQFFGSHFFRCRFFCCPFFRCRYFTHQFCVALFSYPPIFRCRFFLLPKFPVAISSVAVFSVAPFQLPFLPFTRSIATGAWAAAAANVMLRAEVRGSTQSCQN